MPGRKRGGRSALPLALNNKTVSHPAWPCIGGNTMSYPTTAPPKVRLRDQRGIQPFGRTAPNVRE